MSDSAIKFGTSGWRGIIADDFTFPRVRIAVAAVADHVLANSSRAAGSSRDAKPTLLVAHDTRFFAEEFARTAAVVLAERGVRPLICEGPAPTPAVAYEIRRRKVDGAINFTASHNPAEYQGLKFSAADGGPALPEVTKDIEKRAAQLAGKEKAAAGLPSAEEAKDFERIDAPPAYLDRLAELVRFDTIRKAGIKLVYDALHGCGAGYLDAALAKHGIGVSSIRTGRDVLFDGSGPDPSEENLTRLGKAVTEQEAAVGIATDGDADRFGIIDGAGQFFSPNHILGMVYDYLIETRGWRMAAARSVATSHLIDGVAKSYGQTVHQTPVGFKYIGQLILQDAIALGGEESAGLTIRGHVPEKDGILACLLVAEMMAARGASLDEQLRAVFRRAGREYWPMRANLHVPDDVKARTVERLKGEFSEFLGRRVASTDRTDGTKLEFTDGAWVLLRLSGTEPLLRIYTESATREESAQMAEQAKAWVFSAAAGGAKA